MNYKDETPLRHATNYALRIMAHLTKQDKLVSTAQIGAVINISQSYVEQIMTKLNTANLVQAVRGPHGGYQIATWNARRNPDVPINAWEVCCAMQPELALDRIESWHMESVYVAIESALCSVRFTQ